MHKLTIHIDYHDNLGKLERGVRGLLGILLLTIPFNYTGENTALIVISALLSIPLIVTAITHWDPLYAIMHVNSCEESGNHRATGVFAINLGKSDRILRTALGIGLLTAVLTIANLPIQLLVTCALLSIPLLITAMLGWDPLYAVCEVFTVKYPQTDLMQNSHGTRRSDASAIGAVVEQNLQTDLKSKEDTHKKAA